MQIKSPVLPSSLGTAHVLQERQKDIRIFLFFRFSRRVTTSHSDSVRTAWFKYGA